MGELKVAQRLGGAALAARDPLDVDEARAFLRRCSRIISRHAAALTRLDVALGDGDHGDNLLAGFAAIEEQLHEPAPDPDLEDLPSLLSGVGLALVSSVGGASGPLYGAAFMEAGFVARSLDGQGPVPALAALMEAAAGGLARRGHCSVGDKTIYDTLAPAVAAIRDAADRGEDPRTAIRAMIGAANRGMRSTTDLVARRGLALRLGERSRGHRDPGAASCLLLLCALAAPSRRDR
jgi:dihydroxyacetone kinase-like protein